MKDILLKELSSSDISWLRTTGQQEEIAAGVVRTATDILIVLEGSLNLTVPQAEDPLGRTFAALEGQKALNRIARISSGEIVGEIPSLGIQSTATKIEALEKSLVISVSQQQLTVKLNQDVGFASRFYRAIAHLLSERLHDLINQLGRSKLSQAKLPKEMLFVLDTLNDSDIDWMIAQGRCQRVAANTVLVREQRPVEALFILLDGILSVLVSQEQNPLARAFATLEEGEISGQEIARLSKGEIVGETSLLETRLPFATVKALEDSQVLAIPRQQLAVKLQQDVGFASRFYQVIATLLSRRHQQLISRLGYSRRYRQGQSLDEAVAYYEDELDSDALDRISLAANRFDWMLKRLVNC